MGDTAHIRTRLHPAGGAAQSFPPWMRGLTARTTISYVWVTVAFLLASEAVLFVVLARVATEYAAPSVVRLYARQLAVQYALGAAVRANGLTLDPEATFRLHQAHSLLPPGGNPDLGLEIRENGGGGGGSPAVGVLVDRTGHVVASSSASAYPAGATIAVVVPRDAPLIARALAGAGVVSTTIPAATDEVVCSAADTVWSRDGRPIGAIYVRVPANLSNLAPLTSLPELVFRSGLILALVMAPIGSAFGLLTTRGVVRRLRRLASATTEFAAGHYEYQVVVGRPDEVGQLEANFNQMAQQLAESIHERQAYAAQSARLAERARISREIHDAISQDLFSLRMLAFGFRGALPAESQLVAQVGTFEETTERMIREMRALLLELRPAQLQHLGLADALRDLAAAYGTRLGITVAASVAPVALDARAEQALLRVAQEATSNAVRHARATDITITLAVLNGHVALRITDNGAGFESDAAPAAHGLGLRLMRERIEELGGTLAVESAPGQGTTVLATLPEGREP